MISTILTPDARMGWSTYLVTVDGLSICGITDQTPKAAVDRFHALCVAHEAELLTLVKASDERREWNMAHPGKGRNWPAFRNLERMRDRLLKEAGIKDT